jgi:tetratricopeptide (TPR) repeat protein
VALITTKKFVAAEAEILAIKNLMTINPNDFPKEMAFSLEAFLFDRTGKYEKSISSAQEALEVDNYDFFASISITHSLIALKRFEEAEKYANIMTSAPYKVTKLEGMYIKTDIMLSSDRDSEALPLIEEALKIGPPNFLIDELNLMKGSALFSLKKYAEALTAIDKLRTNTHPKSFLRTWLYLESFANIMLKRLDAAEPVINEFSSKFPNDFQAATLKSIFLMEKKNPEEALRTLEHSLNLPNMPADLKEAVAEIYLTAIIQGTIDAIKNNNEEKAFVLFTYASKTKEYISSIYFTKWLVDYLRFLLSKRKNELIIKVFNTVKAQSGNDVVETLLPIVKASEYITTKNIDVLEGMQKEMRQMVVTIVKEYSPETNLPKELS